MSRWCCVCTARRADRPLRMRRCFVRAVAGPCHAAPSSIGSDCGGGVLASDGPRECPLPTRIRYARAGTIWHWIGHQVSHRAAPVLEKKGELLAERTGLERPKCNKISELLNRQRPRFPYRPLRSPNIAPDFALPPSAAASSMLQALSTLLLSSPATILPVIPVLAWRGIS